MPPKSRSPKTTTVVPEATITLDDEIMVVEEANSTDLSNGQRAKVAPEVSAALQATSEVEISSSVDRFTGTRSHSAKVKSNNEGTSKVNRGKAKLPENTAGEGTGSADVPSSSVAPSIPSAAVAPSKTRAKSKGVFLAKKVKSATSNGYQASGNVPEPPETFWNAAVNTFVAAAKGPYDALSASFPTQPGPLGFQMTQPLAGSSAGGFPFSSFGGMAEDLLLNMPSMGAHARLSSSWDPLHCKDWDGSKPLPICHKRMKHDLEAALKDEAETGIYLVPIEEDITKLNALVIGPKGTPYEGGFFVFYVRVAPNYPMVPPRVRNLTNGNGKVRFGPNFYADGKVCLSILGTWSGPSWTAALNLQTMLQSIQSLMSVAALTNEPGFAKLKATDPQVVHYDRFVQHETLRVAVIGILETAMNPPKPESAMPVKFRQAMYSYFEKNFDDFVAICDGNASFDKKSMAGTMTSSGGTYEWSQLKKKLFELKSAVSVAKNQM